MHCILSIYYGNNVNMGSHFALTAIHKICIFTTIQRIRNVTYVVHVILWYRTSYRTKKFDCFCGLTRFSDHSLFGVLQQATYSSFRSHTGCFLTEKRSYDNNGRGNHRNHRAVAFLGLHRMLSGHNVKHTNIHKISNSRKLSYQTVTF